MNVLLKRTLMKSASQRFAPCMARSAAFSSAAGTPYDFQKVFGRNTSLNGVNFHEFPELEGSMMKIVGQDVDTQSADYQENYQKMAELNAQLDEITRATMDVGQR